MTTPNAHLPQVATVVAGAAVAWLPWGGEWRNRFLPESRGWREWPVSMGRSSVSSVFASLSLAGRVWGEVRRLEGFDKKRHTVPDQVNGATQSFLAKLAAPQLTEDGEALFQACRQGFGYKRRELSLSVGNGSAQLETRDFTLEIRWELDPEEPHRYFVESELTRAASRDLLESQAFADAVGARFDRLRCGLVNGVSVASVIDAVEDEETDEMSVDYPSDCSECLVRIQGIDADVVVDGQRLELRYPRLTTAAALLEAYDEMGRRLAVSPDLNALRLVF